MSDLYKYEITYQGPLDKDNMINLWRYGKSIQLVTTFISKEMALMFAEEFGIKMSNETREKLSTNPDEGGLWAQ